jgi:flagellar hook-length control protein FliK
MSLVPFPAPTTTAPRDASGPARPAAPPSKGPGAAFAERGQATGRAANTIAPGRGASRFAHVLASVQEQEETTPATSDAERTARDAHVSGGDAKQEKAEAPCGSSAPVPIPADTAVAPVQTPWLLLALGSGSYTRMDEEAAESPEPSSVECFAAGVEQLPLVVAAQVPVPAPDVGQPPVEASATPTPAMPHALAGVEAGATALPESSRAPRADVDPATAPQAPRDVAIEIDVSDATSPEPAIAGTDPDEAVLSSPPVDAAAAAAPTSPAPRTRESDDVPPVPEVLARDASPANSTAAALARWHVAAGRSVGAVAARPTVSTATSDPAAIPRTPGLAASRLAQALGAASERQPSHVEGQSQPVSADLPSPRPADVFTRVSVGAPREGHEPRASAVSLGQVFAATAAGASTLPAGPSAAATTTTPLAAAAGEQVLQQLVSSIKMQWKDGIGEAKLHLRPDALGAVSVSLRVEAGAVTAVVRAESAQVQHWVLQHQQTLRQQMEAAGLRLDELVVSPDDQRQQARDESSPDPQHRRSRGQTRANAREDEPRFELLA